MPPTLRPDWPARCGRCTAWRSTARVLVSFPWTSEHPYPTRRISIVTNDYGAWSELTRILSVVAESPRELVPPLLAFLSSWGDTSHASRGHPACSSPHRR